MIKIYVKFLVNSSGESPGKLVERLRRIGAVPLVGEYDVEILLEENERLFHKLEAVHRALKGTGAFYSVSSGIEGSGLLKADTSTGRRKTQEMKKKFYRAKLSRWREMGIDTSALEKLLEKDLDKFKEVSQAYIRDHLAKEKVVKGDEKELMKMDEEIYSTIDDLGISLINICKVSGMEEEDIILSLGRLISAGKVEMISRDGKEVYAQSGKPSKSQREVEVNPAKSEAEAIQRVLAGMRTKGSTMKQLVRDSRLPENQVMDALAELLKTNRLRSVKRGRGTAYLRIPGK